MFTDRHSLTTQQEDSVINQRLYKVNSWLFLPLTFDPITVKIVDTKVDGDSIKEIYELVFPGL